MNTSNPSLVNTQQFTVTLVALNKLVETFDGLDHQYTPEKQLYQIDAHMMFTIGGQLSIV